MIQNENLSRRITSLRWPLMFCIVCLHTGMSTETIQGLGINYSEPNWYRWIHVFLPSGLICNGAVPLFFLFAAFLQFSKNDDYKTLLKKRSKSIVLPYIIWIILTILIYIILGACPLTEKYFFKSKDSIHNWVWVDWIQAFIGYGRPKNGPFVGQFWFLRDLIVLILFSPIIKKIYTLIPHLSVIAILFLFLSGLDLYVVRTNSLVFYFCGMLWSITNFPLFEHVDRISWLEIISLFIICAVCSVLNVNYIGFFSVIISILLFIKLSGVFIKNEKVFDILKYLERFSFFMFAIHMPVLSNAIKMLSLKVFPLYGAWYLIRKIIISLILVFLSTGIGILTELIMPKVFDILNGRRKSYINKLISDENK